MPRRSVLTEAQHAELFALPESEPDLVRYWTLSSADLRVFTSRSELMGWMPPSSGVV
ncbi:DUF4158 domain-containing protein [Sphingomonas sp. S-NIH.Pt1_0416]|uniref:DUF4158 domain-containing protein n=1 Tax=Sphingomonas sp. S-NIH.Pt1_0416 TaxID=1920123 RepID=UPI0013DF975B|nr:DUF4158 domain-containing protein [Sphingomonas sp. S-NIH.Pt1_0416]